MRPLNRLAIAAVCVACLCPRLAADRLSAALKSDATRRVSLTINSDWFDDAPSDNVIGELHGSEHPEHLVDQHGL